MTNNLKNKTAFSGSMLKMNGDTYAMRRKVMDFIYNVKRKGYDIQRQEIRVVKGCRGAFAYAYIGCNVMHFDIACFNVDKDFFEVIILHELCHSALGIARIEGCPLMDCYNITASSSTAWKLFDMYYNKFINK